VRYKQTVIGVAWAVIRPLLTTIVFTVVFSKIAKLSAPATVPYALFVMAANLPWQFFATALSESSNSLIGNANLISKIYFPRLIVPAGSVITSFVDFLITLGLMALMMVLVSISARLAAAPAARVHGARFRRGLRHRPVVVRAECGIPRLPLHRAHSSCNSAFSSRRWATARTRVPVLWHWHNFDIPARLLYSLNPMVGVIDGFRWCLLRGPIAD
jgi:lipopolysaccharide transport system permease protein